MLVMRRRGHTLVELLCVLVIAGLVLATATPGVLRLVRQHRLAAAVNDFHAALLLARSEALRRGARVDLVAADGGWRAGWIVLIDANRNGRADPGEEILRQHGPLPEDISVSASLSDMRVPYLGYSPAGRSSSHSGASQSGSWTFDSGGARRRLVVNFFGRVRGCNPDGERADC
jgi:type IV fimbrial biogenesis protein FimT